MIEYQMPKMDHMSEEAYIAQWKIKVGDAVQPGQVIMSIETAKNTLDVEAAFAGKLKEIVVQEGETVPVNTLIARFDEV